MDPHQRSVSLMKFLAKVASDQGVAEHIYVVGGAVRNWVIGQPIKDIDIVLDSVAIGRDSNWFAQAIQAEIPTHTKLVTNQYGVAILSIAGPWKVDGRSMKGETIEIANARKESYGGAGGKGYKPHMVEPATIQEDLYRREFTFNTLLWRLADLLDGPHAAPVLDLLGVGRQHLEERVLRTPADPAKTFSDDPTRMLRAVKFTARYGFEVPEDLVECIRDQASKLKQMPWDAVRKILVEDILEGPTPRDSLKQMVHLGLADAIADVMRSEPGFASAVGRSLAGRDPHIILDVHSLGWPVKTPASFLDANGRARLRCIVDALDPVQGHEFLLALEKPPIDQVRLFKSYPIPLKDRGLVSSYARQAILDNPSLVDCPKDLEEVVEIAVIREFGSMSLSGYKLAKCEKPCGNCKKRAATV